MSRTLKIGILGSGFIARTHAHSISTGCTGAKLAGIAGGSRAAALASDFGVECFVDPAQLASSTHIDAVIIATPHACHHEHALLCARHRKHVLLEKPMATSVARCQEIVNAFRSEELTLMVAFSQRFRQSNITARDLLSSGAIGKVLMIQEQALVPNGLRAYPAWQQRPENLGVLFGYGIHSIDKLRWFLDDEPDALSAQSIRASSGIETSTMATLHWRRGTITNVWSGVDLPSPGFPASAFRSLVVGEHGLLDVDGYGAVRLARSGGDWETVFVQPPIDWQGAGMFSEARMGSFNAQNQAFVDASLAGTDPPITGLDGLRAVEIALAAYESAATNRTVHFPST